MSLIDGIGKTEHPSYGQLRLSRVTSSKRVPLYGTANQCRETIQLTICHSTHNRDLNRDWHLAGDAIIEVEMSPAQYAEMISSLNMGSGTPVTIRWLKGQGRIPDPPYQDHKDLFDTEFKSKVDEAMQTVSSLIDEAKSLQGQKAVTKKILTTLLNKLEGIRTELLSNIPFVARSFSEHMSDVVSSGKIELESFIEGKVHRLGLEALKDQAPSNPLLEKKTGDSPHEGL